MSGSYANAAARRRRVGATSIQQKTNQSQSYSALRQQNSNSNMSFSNDEMYRSVAPPGKIHIQDAFNILIERVNNMDAEIQDLRSRKNDDYSSHITLLFEKLSSIERRFSTLIRDNSDSLNTENLNDTTTDNGSNNDDVLVDDSESVQNETTTFNFVKKEELNQAVSNVVAKEEFNEIMTNVGKDIGHITERTMQLNELLLQVQNGNIMLNNAISTIRQEMKKRYVVDSKSTSTDVVENETDNVKEIEKNKTSTDLKSMNKDEIADEVKRELSVVADNVNESNNGDDDGVLDEDQAESNE